MRLDRRTLFLTTLATAAGASGVAHAVDAPIETLRRPTSGHIKVAFLIDAQTNIMDLAGAWEPLSSAGLDEQHFECFTVSALTQGATLGGISAQAWYTLESAPQPHVIVMGAQSGAVDPGETTQARVDWIRRMAPGADIVMSVCTGAFLLARTGLIDGRLATTHHNFYDNFASQFPNVRLERGRRFVDNGKFISAGGLSSGVDGALHLIARYFGTDEAEAVAGYIEHYTTDWRTGAPARA